MMKKTDRIKISLFIVLVASILLGWLAIELLTEPTQIAPISASQVMGDIEYVDTRTGKLTKLKENEKIFPDQRVVSHEDGSAMFFLHSGQAAVKMEPFTSLIFRSANPGTKNPAMIIELEVGQLLVATENTSLGLTTSAGTANLTGPNGILWVSVSYPGIKSTFHCISGPCVIENEVQTAQLSDGEYAVIENMTAAWIPQTNPSESNSTPLFENTDIQPENNDSLAEILLKMAGDSEENKVIPSAPQLITGYQTAESQDNLSPDLDDNNEKEPINQYGSTPTPAFIAPESTQESSFSADLAQVTPETILGRITTYELDAGMWVLNQFGYPYALNSLPESLTLTLEYDDSTGTVTGMAGCNRYFGELLITSDNKISILGPLVTTQMACFGGVPDYESIYLDLLSKMVSYQIYNGQLQIFTKDSQIMIFDLGPLDELSTSTRPSVPSPTPTPEVPEGSVYFVAVNGNDNNPGTLALPWATPQKAANTARAGDTVYFRGGTYNGGMVITSIGTKDNWIVFTAYPGEIPIINNVYGDALAIRTNLSSDRSTYAQMTSYIEVSGLKLKGASKGIRIDQAHHVRILNNTVFNSAKGGIILPNGGDHILLQGNVIYGNSNGGAPCSSAISIWNSGCFFGETSTCKLLNDGAAGYHVIVSGNLIYANRNDDASCSTSGPTDGNGIIMDNNGANNPLTLISNNILLRNGGRCIQVLNTSNTHIYNNTCYQNVQTPRLIDNGSGELQIMEHSVNGFEMDIKNVEFRNNLVYGHGKASLFRVWEVPGETPQYIEDNNLFYNGLLPATIGDNSIIANPMLIALPTCSAPYSCDWSSFDFNLQENSPAINAGASLPGVRNDYEGTVRPQGDGYDIGAFERILPQ